MSAQTESEFLQWRRDEALPINRSVLFSGVVAGVIQTLAFGLLRPEGFLPWLALSAVLIGTVLVVFAASRRPGAETWIQGALAVSLACSGFMTSAILTFHLRSNVLGFAATVALMFMTFTSSRLRPLQAIVAAGSFCAFQLALAAHAFASGEVTIVEVAIQGAMLPTLFAGAVQQLGAGELALRRAFRQQRVIDAQRKTIADERQRSEALLKQELGHQVAARSRELGRMLASSVIVPGRPKVGERFDGRYRIVRELGAGAMGAVFEVLRTTDDARLALKVVTGEVSAERAKRFAREVEIGARVRHPNLVEIVDVGLADGLIPYLAMQLAPQGSLDALRHRFGDVAWARPILSGVASGLRALHEAGVVHRDLKPANVLLFGGVPKISDFGISRFGEVVGDVDAALASTHSAGKPLALTMTGMLLGTPFYMAPEALDGKVDARADVFSFGILAVEMLAGREPFTAPPMFLALSGQKLEATLDLDRIEPALRGTLLACLAEDPALRPTIHAVCDGLG